MILKRVASASVASFDCFLSFVGKGLGEDTPSVFDPRGRSTRTQLEAPADTVCGLESLDVRAKIGHISIG